MSILLTIIRTTTQTKIPRIFCFSTRKNKNRHLVLKVNHLLIESCDVGVLFLMKCHWIEERNGKEYWNIRRQQSEGIKNKTNRRRWFLAPGNYFLLGDSFVEDFYFVILVLSGRILNYVMDEWMKNTWFWDDFWLRLEILE
jgi:hypothetical protein